MTRAEWKGRSDFAEFAEAVGVSTVEVMAAMGTGGSPDGTEGVLVLYSPGVTEDMDEDELALKDVRRAILRRDERRLLSVVKDERVGTLGEFRARMDELMIEWTE